MNERLKQIMIESGTHKYISAECQHRIEIVAELIVRECAQRVDYWESRQGEHTEDLLKHFGVTE